jgi:NTP pyrophosphatase (non-canonical NTP hydrolase)
MDEKEVFNDAVYYFGRQHQRQKAIEELSELIKEVSKEQIGEGNLEHLAEEMADVEITMEQLKIMYENTALVAKYRAEKVARLAGMIFDLKYPVG